MTPAICYVGAGEMRFQDAQGTPLPAEPAAIGTPLLVVMDIDDEAQTVASLPLVRGRDASLLQKRRLEREFPGAAMRLMLPLNRRPAEGVADVVMLAVDSAGAWTEQLAALGKRWALRSIRTVAMLAGQWMQQAGQTDRQVLVVLPTPVGTRLIFLDRGRPLLSRLVSEAFADTVPVEIGRTIQYLHNTQRVPRDVKLELWFWGMDEATVTASLPPGENYEVGAAPEVAGLPDPERDGFGALLQLAARVAPAHQLAPHAWRAGWYARVLRRWGAATAATILLAGIATAGVLWSRTQQLLAETATVLADNGTYQERRAQFEQSATAVGLTVDELLLLPAAATAVKQGEVAPRAALELAAKVFGSRNEVVLRGLEFASAPLGPTVPEGTGTCAAGTPEDAARLQGTFRMIEGLDVRRRVAALTAVREASGAVAPWQAGADPDRLGQLQPLTASSGVDVVADATEWTVCLVNRSRT